MSKIAADRIGIAGAGAWGTALATCLATTGQEIIVWGRDRERVLCMHETRAHPALPSFQADRNITFSPDVSTLSGTDILVLALPAQSIAQASAVLGQAGIDPDVILLAAKGLEAGTMRTMPELAADLWPRAKIAILSGPTFATELALGLPAAAVIAARDAALPAELATRFSGSALRVYASNDPVGVALGGAVKNVIAIAAGAVTGAGLGSNARAAIISRGLAELTRLGLALGARQETLAGLSGLGDLVLSCTDTQSRNYSLGQSLGRGQPPSTALTEGAHTVAPLLGLAARHQVEMPIAAAVDAVINKNMPLTEAVAGLMSRPGKPE